MNYNEFAEIMSEVKAQNPRLFDLGADKTVGEETISKWEKEYGYSLPEDYKAFLKKIGGGYFGYTVIYSFDENGQFCITEYVSKEMINELQMIPIIDFETGDYAGFDMKNGMLTDELVIWLHDERMKKRLDIDFYELLVKCGLRNEHLV